LELDHEVSDLYMRRRERRAKVITIHRRGIAALAQSFVA